MLMFAVRRAICSLATNSLAGARPLVPPGVTVVPQRVTVVPQRVTVVPQRVTVVPPGVTVVTCAAGAERALAALREVQARDPNRMFACDTEVVGLDLKRQSPVGQGRVICATIYAGEDVDFGGGPRLFIDNLDEAEGTLDLFKGWLEDSGPLKVWHNYSFDRHVLHNHGINCRGFGADTMHMARLWDASRAFKGGYSLEGLSKDILGDRKRPIKERFGRKMLKDGTEAKIAVMPDLEEVHRGESTRHDWIDYATYDAVATWNLHAELSLRLANMEWVKDKRTMLEYYQKMWRPFGEILTDMERSGVHVDTSQLVVAQARATDDADAHWATFRAWAAKQGADAKLMNVKSIQQLQQLLFAPFRPDKGDKELVAERVFKTENEAGIILAGKLRPLKHISFLIKGLGLPVKQLSASGMPSVDAVALKLLAGNPHATPPDYGDAYEALGGGDAGRDGCIAIDAVVSASAIEKLLNTYIVPLQETVDGQSRTHCSLNINTETGRLSARRPNLQNQPSLDKDIYKIRNAFCAPPGSKLVVADYGQLELRLLAHMSNCASMIAAFKAGGDFHSRTALAMYDEIRAAVDNGDVLLEWDYAMGPIPKPLLKERYGAERRQAKTLNFSIAYGKTAGGLARDWGTSVQEAKETLKRWYDDRPEVLLWQKHMISEAHLYGYTRTLMGRYRKLPDINSRCRKLVARSERAVINTPVQGGAADVVMMAMIGISENARLREMNWRLILQIHDEVILEGPEETATEALAIVTKCMEHPYKCPLLVDLVVDAKIVQTWYEAK